MVDAVTALRSHSGAERQGCLFGSHMIGASDEASNVK